MMILVKGKNGSGKSVFAEKLASEIGGSLYYIATMKPFGEEGRFRVMKHRKQRRGLGFKTLELPFSVGGADIRPGSTVLIEDISNLLSNAMFEKGATEDRVFDDIVMLCGRSENSVAVTVSEFDGGDYDEETVKYIEALYSLNARLEDIADVVIERRGQVCAGSNLK